MAALYAATDPDGTYILRSRLVCLLGIALPLKVGGVVALIVTDFNSLTFEKVQNYYILFLYFLNINIIPLTIILDLISSIFLIVCCVFFQIYHDISNFIYKYQ